MILKKSQYTHMLKITSKHLFLLPFWVHFGFYTTSTTSKQHILQTNVFTYIYFGIKHVEISSTCKRIKVVVEFHSADH